MDFKNHINLDRAATDHLTIISAEEGNQKVKGMFKGEDKTFLMTQVKLLNTVMSEPSVSFFLCELPSS